MKNHKIFQRRYDAAYKYCSKLLQAKLSVKGAFVEKENINLIQSVLNSPEIVSLLCTEEFNQGHYKPLLLQAIESTRKELFPDLAKKRFISIERINLTNNPIIENKIIHKAPKSNPISLLGNKSQAYLNKISKTTLNKINHTLLVRSNLDEIDKKIDMLSSLFPDAQIPDLSQLKVQTSMSREDIINIYKCLLSGIENRYPRNFLASEAKKRSAILVQFLVHNILNLSHDDIIRKVTPDLLRKYKLQNVLRYFNYSAKQVCLNAFPALLPEWQKGKTNIDYWKHKPNRIKAIKWLIENCLNIDIYNCKKLTVSKDDFSRNGLSYLFNTNYNSVSKALEETYPWIKPWQTGNIPKNYWNGENAQIALKWLIAKCGWQIDDLPIYYAKGEFERKTFSSFGLAGLFEKKFKCNIYQAVSHAWPGRFKFWEFGEINYNFWNSMENKIHFAKWTVKKFGLKTDSLPRNLNTQLFDTELSHYKFYSGLKRKFNGDLLKVIYPLKVHYKEMQKSRMVIRKWDTLIKSETNSPVFSNFLLHGFFYGLVKNISTHRIETFTRIKKRHLAR